MPDEAEISAKFIAVVQRYTHFSEHFQRFQYFNSKNVRSKNSKDRECQKTTEIFLILLSLRQKNFLKQELKLFHNIEPFHFSG